jgi:branched-chain amino acid transport system permease protein
VYAVSRLRWTKLASDELSQVLLTFGLLLVFADVARVRWEGLPRSLSEPAFAAGAWGVAGVSFPTYRVLMGAVALALAAALWWLQERTRFGAMVRAGVDDREMLEATGVASAPLFLAVFALSGLLAGLAGGIAAPVAFGKALMPTFAEFTMMALVVVVLAWRPQGLLGGAR